MKLAIMQPYFLPYIGYWQLINAVDTFVIYDDVNYIKGGWINRNFIMCNKQKHLFTIALEDSSPYKLINEIKIKDNFSKLLKTVKQEYSKAPYFNDTFLLLNEIFEFTDKNLAKFISNSIKLVSRFIGLHTKFIVSSELTKDNSLHGEAKVLHINKILNADIYINAIGGKTLYSSDRFNKERIELKFLQPAEFEYPQFNYDFIPNLSILDLMMFNSQEQLFTFMSRYKLV